MREGERHMESIRELRRAVALYLRGQDGLLDGEVLEAFPAAQRDFPVKKPLIAVGIEAVETAPQGLGGYWGERGEERLHGAGAVITLRFDLYCPVGVTAGGLHELYEGLCDCLLLRGSPFHVGRLWCGDTAYDKLAGALHMTARAEIRSALLTGEPVDRFDRVWVRKNETGR